MRVVSPRRGHHVALLLVALDPVPDVQQDAVGWMGDSLVHGLLHRRVQRRPPVCLRADREAVRGRELRVLPVAPGDEVKLLVAERVPRPTHVNAHGLRPKERAGLQVLERLLVVPLPLLRVVLPHMHPVHMVVGHDHLPLGQRLPHLLQVFRVVGRHRQPRRQRPRPDVRRVQSVAILDGLQIAEDVHHPRAGQTVERIRSNRDLHDYTPWARPTTAPCTPRSTPPPS